MEKKRRPRSIVQSTPIGREGFRSFSDVGNELLPGMPLLRSDAGGERGLWDSNYLGEEDEA